LYREYRFALPLNLPEGQVAYEVPYGVLEVGKDEMEGSAGERYIHPCRETRPRGIQNWIGAYDGNVSVILSSTVAVADFRDPTTNPIPNPMLQPVLIASRKSCHWEGNDYLQTGDHTFHFTLTSTLPDWRNGYKSGIQANEKLITVVAPAQYLVASLPEELSFAGTDASNVLITTLKKAEDDQQAVIRMVEMEGRDIRVTLNTFRPIERFQQTNLIEEPIRIVDIPGEIKINIGHHAIETFGMN
jgi:alpha-mannosidase